MRFWKELFRKKSIAHILSDVAAQDSHSPSALSKRLTTVDLTAFGVAAILGAGVFSTIGNAAAEGGPGVVFLFIFTAIACVFSAFCYAEFASRIPIAGSAYTYAYASFGEIIAWIIGWDLIMEYAIGNIAIAISWSQYLTGLLSGYGIAIPKYLTIDFFSAMRGFHHVQGLLSEGKTLQDLSSMNVSTMVMRGYDAWEAAPRIAGIPFVFDFPALFIIALITWIVYMGIQESRVTSNILVAIKLFALLLVVGAGAFYVRPENWTPFMPNGIGGVLKGVSAVFFAYIGFDAISTTAEECKNPQRDLPRGMMYSLLICTVLYILVSLVLTGVVDYRKLGVGDPLAFVFGPEGANLPWLSAFIDFSAVIALSTVFLVFQLGQPRIWMAMSRDGLLPPIFSRIHPKYRTPGFATIVAGFFVAVPSLFMNLTEVTDLTSIGTLFAFVLVCGGILRIDVNDAGPRPKFKTPYVNGKFLFPLILLTAAGIVSFLFPEKFAEMFARSSDWPSFFERLPFFAYVVFMVVLSVRTYIYNHSLIPLLGLATCSYLMTELGVTNWLRFTIWLLVGFFVYFLYGKKHSKARLVPAEPEPPLRSFKSVSHAAD